MADPTNNDLSYLSDTFDANKLKIQELRSILSKHGVDSPKAKKKADFVELFNKNITPKKDKLLKEATKQYGKPPKQLALGEEVQSKGGVGSSKQTAKEAKTVVNTPVTPRRTTRRSIVAYSSSEDEGEPEVIQPRGKGGKKPVVQEDEGETSPFSDTNVFQASASPLQEARKAKLTKKKAAAATKEPAAVVQPEDSEAEKYIGGPKLERTPVKTARKTRHSVAGGETHPPEPFTFKKSFEPTLENVDDETVVETPEPPRATSSRRKTYGGEGIPAAASVRKRGGRKSMAAQALKPSSDDDVVEEITAVESGEEDTEDKAEAGASTGVSTPARFMSIPPLTPGAVASYSDQPLTSVPPPLTSPSGSEDWSTFSPRKDAPSDSVARKKRQTSTFRRRSTVPPPKVDRLFVALCVFTVVAMGFSHWYWEARDVIGYCDPLNPAKNEGPYTGYNPLGFVLPTCKDCPPHSVCVDKTILSCEPANYTTEVNILARLLPTKLLPFPLDQPSCVKDLRKQREEQKRDQHVETLLTVLNTAVRTWVGTAECGGFVPEITDPVRSHRTGHVLGMPWSLAKQNLRNVIGRKWDDTKFDTYWNYAIGRIRHPDPDHVVPLLTEVMDEANRTRLFQSREPPIMSLTCRLRRSIWETSKTYWMQLSGMGITVVFFVWFWFKRQTVAREARIVSQLVEDVLDAVSEEAENNRVDPVRYPMPGMAVAQLKDFFLVPHTIPGLTPIDTSSHSHEQSVVDEASGRTRFYVPDESTRDRIWDNVTRLVEKNSGLRETVMEIRGESHLVWQWIGSAALSPRKKVAAPHRERSVSPARKLDFGAGASGAGEGGSGRSSEAEPLLHSASSSPGRAAVAMVGNVMNKVEKIVERAGGRGSGVYPEN
ncbi:Man1-Src1p-C-terminal domain-containing protein [Fimicolochytrium jonesii]|uniref:Man1-Src1p-C-terminal domain-containing protein n=1 Tax=Fimicolochytrium jonesii TaxID=1396493 RepID=UPI0022FE5D91|nr:Man1-Src1p-C-terminal domain-containing protein [Fimicolochytrium jonesii]KAI8816340.1 Man1-Src1p-C-terminal domain-containing protein [Fimicolochytrium jonesii]